MAKDEKVSAEKLSVVVQKMFLKDAQQDAGWRTTSNGKHYKIDTETGQITKGNIGMQKGTKVTQAASSPKPAQKSKQDQERQAKYRAWRQQEGRQNLQWVNENFSESKELSKTFNGSMNGGNSFQLYDKMQKGDMVSFTDKNGQDRYFLCNSKGRYNTEFVETDSNWMVKPDSQQRSSQELDGVASGGKNGRVLTRNK